MEKEILHDVKIPYVSPSIAIWHIEMEKGFAQSTGVVAGQWEGTEQGSWEEW